MTTAKNSKNNMKIIVPILTLIIGILIAWCWCRYHYSKCPDAKTITILQNKIDSLQKVIINDVTTTGCIDGCDNNPSPDGDNVSGIRVPSIDPDRKMFTEAYESRMSVLFPGQPIVKGGAFNKCIVEKVLKSLGAVDTMMHYYFGIDNTDPQHPNRLNLILVGGSIGIHPTLSGRGGSPTDKLMYRTGKDAFCPLMCD